MKNKIILILLLLLLLTLGGFYFYYTSSKQQQVELEKGMKVLKTIKSEQKRCSDLLSRKEGAFSDYEYCRQLLQKLSE